MRPAGFLLHDLRAQSRILLAKGLHRIGGDLVRPRSTAFLRFHLGKIFFLALESLQAALIEIASPDHDLVGIADAIERGDLAAGKLFAILTGQRTCSLNCAL